MRFRKLPVVVDAEQFLVGSPFPDGLCNKLDAPVGIANGACYPHVHTLEGALTVSHGDWIVTGINGERYPVKPDIFARTYEPEKPTPGGRDDV
jgi:hypothetical protein